MRSGLASLALAVILGALIASGSAAAQTRPPGVPPAQEPPALQVAQQVPAGRPILAVVELRFPTQGNRSVIDPRTYLFYIKSLPSEPSRGITRYYDEKTVLEDFRRLWATNFLDDLSVDVSDTTMADGRPAKKLTFDLTERQRVKIVDYELNKALDQTKIDEKLKEANAQIRLDSFLDQGIINKVESIMREMLLEKGLQFARVTHAIKELAGGPKLVQLTFNVDPGPKVKIETIDFVGNKAFSDGDLKGEMKKTKEAWWLSWLTGRGTYDSTKYEEDIDKVIEKYRDNGYIAVRVGEPKLIYGREEGSGHDRVRWVTLQIPVTEGPQYRVGEFKFEGNTVFKSQDLRPLFKLKEGDVYREGKIRKGLEQLRDVYGARGYFQFTGYPDLQPRDEEPPPEGAGASSAAAEAAAPAGSGADGEAKPAGQAQPSQAGQAPQDPARAGDGAAKSGAPASSSATSARQRPELARARGRGKPPIVDVTMRLQEDKQYFVGRITFLGNSTTRDNVIRREIRLWEGGVFNTEALKYSVRRINQLGYFKNVEQKDINVEKDLTADNKVNLTMKVEEQNRNQFTFGAGVSQFEGVFGQLQFQTSNFLGRGETLTLSIQSGSRAQNYQLAFTEPFLFDRPITGGFDLFKRRINFINQFTQQSTGTNLVFGFPLAGFTRLFMNYSFERVMIRDLNTAFTDPRVLNQNPFLRDALLVGQNGLRTISKVVPSIVHNTVDNPIFPSRGVRYTASIDLAGLGGNTKFLKPMLEGVWFVPHTRRTSLGMRVKVEYIRPYAGTKELPIFERLFEGGEYSVRGFDIRSLGPRDPTSSLVIGGDKSLVANAEYLITIAGPVRLVMFYDAGQVRDEKQSFKLSEFKTSTGAEVRFFMPVLNVPFRLIFAYNPNRKGVFDNNLLPQKAFTFRFAVGTTF